MTSSDRSRRGLAAVARLFAHSLLALGAAAACAATADVARETRWAEQVVPQLVVGDAVWLATPRHPRVLALYTEPAKSTREAVVVVHGMGVNPDWNVIGVLRTALADRGFATLSVQMPVLAADAPSDQYGTLFPDAGERLTAAVSWLRAKGYARIAIVSHSMGSAMTDAWLAHAPPGIDAWVPVGMMDPFTVPPRQPVLDVVAERDFPQALSASKARKPQLPRDACSGSIVVGNTDHYFGDAAPRLAEAIAPFIARAFGGLC